MTKWEVGFLGQASANLMCTVGQYRLQHLRSSFQLCTGTCALGRAAAHAPLWRAQLLHWLCPSCNVISVLFLWQGCSVRLEPLPLSFYAIRKGDWLGDKPFRMITAAKPKRCPAISFHAIPKGVCKSLLEMRGWWPPLPALCPSDSSVECLEAAELWAIYYGRHNLVPEEESSSDEDCDGIIKLWVQLIVFVCIFMGG